MIVRSRQISSLATCERVSAHWRRVHRSTMAASDHYSLGRSIAISYLHCIHLSPPAVPSIDIEHNFGSSAQYIALAVWEDLIFIP